MIYSFDIISDLNLTSETEFDYTGKATSLFCIVAGNITNDTTVLHKFFKQISPYYQGIFFIDGFLEQSILEIRQAKIQEIHTICKGFKNIVYLHNNVVVLDGIGIIGLNGWYNNIDYLSMEQVFHVKAYKYDDLTYLENTIEKLQLHPDVKKMIIVSSSVPDKDLYYGEVPNLIDETPLNYCLPADTENKITYWVFGSYKKIVDTNLYGINYCNNPPISNLTGYYPKRLEIEL